MLRQQNKRFCATTWQLLNRQEQLRNQTTATKAAAIDTQAEWDQARPYEEIPSLTTFELARAYMPGGKYYKKDLQEIALHMFNEYGKIVRFPKIFGRPSMVFTHSPPDFERVFRNEGIWPDRPGNEALGYHRTKHQAEFYKGVEGLIATKGEQWGKFRTVVNPVLMQPKNVRLYLQKMAPVNREFVERIREIRDPQTNEVPASFLEEVNRWTLESISVVAVDKQLGLLRENRDDPFAQKLFENISAFFKLSYELEGKPNMWKVLATPNFKRFMKVMDNMQEVTSHYVNEAVERLKEEKKNGVEKPENEKSVLEKLLKIDRNVAVVMAMDMLMAGVDTTSTAFASVLFCLSKNPEKQAKLREELRRILPNKDSEFTEHSLNDMSYLRACIKEALRVYPLVIGNLRVVQNDIVASGYRLPKGSHVFMLVSALTNDDTYYPRAKEFLPERWLRTQKDAEAKECPNSLKTSNPFVYLPFGFGPRSCIGKRIVELELELGIARVIRNFNVAYNYPAEKPFRTELINVPNVPLTFQFTEVDK